jgi:6-pyruvoyltetrahydropterin/6-carboxytetrahydropterin synthase
LSATDNTAIYGKCSNPYGHGHDYTLEIGVAGVPDAFSSRLVDVTRLDLLVESEVLSRLRYRDLNTEVPELAGNVPTSENLLRAIWTMLERVWNVAFPEGRPALDRIRVQETRRNSFEVVRLS